MEVRPPAVSGAFYPSDRGRLMAMVQKFLSDGELCARKIDQEKGLLKAIIVPHAGYVYSGPIAGSAYRLLKNFSGDAQAPKILLLGLSHHRLFHGAAVSTFASWQTPLGRVVVKDLRSEVADSTLLKEFEAAHRDEHSLEVQLPFLQTIFNDFTLYPLALSDVDPKELAHALSDFCAHPDVLIVVSSDLSHYLPYRQAVAEDAISSECILHLDTGQTKFSLDACNKTGVLTLMHLAKMLELKPYVIDYRNSGDTAGDRSAVVGYGAYAFFALSTAPAAPAATISKQTKTMLLKIARAAIARELNLPCQDPLAEGTLDPETKALLEKPYGVFVSLHKRNGLRGCIGIIETKEPLRSTLPERAELAAFGDPRFKPLTAEELCDVTIEISLLSPPKPLTYQDSTDLLNKLIPLQHGIVIRKDLNSATFLPQVWKMLPKKEDFLSRLCIKAGLNANEWKSGKLEVETYEAEVLSEEGV